MTRCALTLAVAAALGLACTPENGPLMRPGEDCLRCHGGSSGGAEGEREEEARAWSLAGTVYATTNASANAGVEGADIDITDATGFHFQLHSNLAGNFYVADAVTFPVQACVTRNGHRNCMEGGAPNGACNSCHAIPPSGNAEGRIAAP